MVIALALIVLGIAAGRAEADYPGSIAGTVTDAVTKLPVEGLQVCANAEDGFPGPCGTTTDDGRYTITDLQVDSYRVIFEGEPQGYQWQEYHGELGLPASRVEVGAGPVTDIDAEVHPWGRIEGTVRQAGSGDPVEGIRVCAFGVGEDWSNRCDKSAADGSYELEEVRPGKYVIEFLTDWATVSSQFYPDKEVWAEAETLDVELSQVLTRIDAHLEPASRVEGTVRRADDGSPLQGIQVCARTAAWSTGYFCTHSKADGTYAFVAMYTDQYLIEFHSESPRLLTEFWDDQEEAAAAELLTVEDGTVLTGIDADIKAAPAPEGGTGPSTAPSATAVGSNPLSAISAPSSEILPLAVPSPAPIVRRHCPPGFRKVPTGRHERCVRRRDHRDRHRKTHSAPAKTGRDGTDGPVT